MNNRNSCNLQHQGARPIEITVKEYPSPARNCTFRIAFIFLVLFFCEFRAEKVNIKVQTDSATGAW